MVEKGRLNPGKEYIVQIWIHEKSMMTLDTFIDDHKYSNSRLFTLKMMQIDWIIFFEVKNIWGVVGCNIPSSSKVVIYVPDHISLIVGTIRVWSDHNSIYLFLNKRTGPYEYFDHVGMFSNIFYIFCRNTRLVLRTKLDTIYLLKSFIFDILSTY